MTVVDTHAVIWLTQEPAKLSPVASRALLEARADGTLAIADITLREIAWSISTGRVLVSTPLGTYLAFVESLFNVVAINGAIAERSFQFSRRYPRDPADRLIGATAAVHGERLVTKDRAIQTSGEVNCVW